MKKWTNRLHFEQKKFQAISESNKAIRKAINKRVTSSKKAGFEYSMQEADKKIVFRSLLYKPLSESRLSQWIE